MYVAGLCVNSLDAFSAYALDDLRMSLLHLASCTQTNFGPTQVGSLHVRRSIDLLSAIRDAGKFLIRRATLGGQLDGVGLACP